MFQLANKLTNLKMLFFHMVFCQSVLYLILQAYSVVRRVRFGAMDICIPSMGAMGHGTTIRVSQPHKKKKSWLLSFWWLIDDY